VPGRDPIPVAQPGGHGNRVPMRESEPGPGPGTTLESDTLLSLRAGPDSGPRRTVPE